MRGEDDGCFDAALSERRYLAAVFLPPMYRYVSDRGARRPQRSKPTSSTRQYRHERIKNANIFKMAPVDGAGTNQ